jgi:hypothetical protein
MHRLRLVALIAVVLATLIAIADPASASIPTHTGIFGAGYTSSPPEGVKNATVTFKVPNVTCALPNDLEFLYLGVFTFDSGAAMSMNAQVQAMCLNGTKVYQAVVANGTSTKLFGVAVGDTIVARVFETGSTSTAIVKDLAKKTSTSISKAAGYDAKVLVGDYPFLRVPTFTSVRMTKAMVNGTPIGDAPALTRERLQTVSNLQIGLSVLATNHSAFSLVFKNNS